MIMTHAPAWTAPHRRHGTPALDGPMLHTIMLVDDSDVDLLFTSVIIERAGIAAKGLAFERAMDALRHLEGPEGHEVDAILLDINMPMMDGFEFLAAYEQLHLQGRVRASILMLTSSPEANDRARALACPHVRDYLLKPLDIKQALGLAAHVLHATRVGRRPKGGAGSAVTQDQ